VPVPVSDTLCGLPDALSVTVIEPERVPVAVGVKVTLIKQFAPAASVVPQLFACAKSLLLVMLAMPITSSPLLVSVIVCGALVTPTGCEPKFRLAGVRLAAGAPAVPASATVCGLFKALSFRVRSPVIFPAPPPPMFRVGEKLTLMVQPAPAATEEPQLSVSTKSASTEIARRSFWFPVFVRVTACGALVEPSAWGPKVRLFGDRLVVVGESS
jgi:hypothetical protein